MFFQKPKLGTVALIIESKKTSDQSNQFVLKSFYSDEREVSLLEETVEGKGDVDRRPGQLSADELQKVVESYRSRQQQEDEEFGDYLEELLSQPFIRPEIQHHGVQWLKSKLKIEQYQKAEHEASQVIAQYAFALFEQNPSQIDFVLSAPNAKVRVRVFVVNHQLGVPSVEISPLTVPSGPSETTSSKMEAVEELRSGTSKVESRKGALARRGGRK